MTSELPVLMAERAAPERRGLRTLTCYLATVLSLATLTTFVSIVLTGDRPYSSVDPVVETVASPEGVKFVARFAPRVRLSPDLNYSHVFSLQNEGRQDLIVKQKSKSCDCLSAKIDREVIKPGEAAKVTLEVKPNSLIHKQATVTIKTDDGASHVYQIQSWTYSPVMLDSGRDLPISFGQLAPGARVSGKHRLTVYSNAEPPPKAKMACCSGLRRDRLHPHGTWDGTLCGRATAATGI